jgi:hypothetical protein
MDAEAFIRSALDGREDGEIVADGACKQFMIG